jgi:hypothetical protein
MDTATVVMERDTLSVRLTQNEDKTVTVILMNRRTGNTVPLCTGTYLDAMDKARRTRDALSAAGLVVGAGIWWED